MSVSCNSSMTLVRDAGHSGLVLRRHEQIGVGGLTEIEVGAGVRVDDSNLVSRRLCGQARRGR